MAESLLKLKCPDCAHEFTLPAGADTVGLTCPHCETEIPKDALRRDSELVEEIAPGFRPGQKLGNYVIESLLGTGGMAVVFRGKQLSLNRHVAIKILPKEYVKKRLFVDRFESEAAVLASLNHPNIVSVIDRGIESDTYFIVMEYVEGDTLKDRIQSAKRIPQADVARISGQALAGLDYAHRRGVIHRDIKPGNIMVNKDQIVKIADFGLAHLAKAQGGLDVTRDNQAMGTLKYMAPEQLTSAKFVDARADLYSFGVVLYELLTGRLPLGMFKMPSECDSALDPRWDDIILRALKMEPRERYSSAEEMARDIHEIGAAPAVAQAAEEEKVVEPEPVSLTACSKCGRESAADARTCESCGADLADLFGKCPGCGQEHRIDSPRCPDCGADLAGYRDKLRRKAETIQSLAKQYIIQHDFERALTELRRLRNFKTREYAGVRKNAEILIDRFKQKSDRAQQRTYEAGLRLFAEGMPERALELWKALPDGYRDVGDRRKQAEVRRDDARQAISEGSRLFKVNDLAGAVSAWEKAAGVFPHDQQLRKRLMEARNALGNLKLRRNWLREAEELAARGNVLEAMELTRRALEMAPDDPEALRVLQSLTAKEGRRCETAVSLQPRIMVTRHDPRAPADVRRSLRWAALIVLTLLIIAGAALGLPALARKRNQTAERLLADAREFFDQGDMSNARGRIDQLLDEYGSSRFAEQATILRADIDQKEQTAQHLCNNVDAAVRAAGNKPDAALEGFRGFSALLENPAVTGVKNYHEHAQRRAKDLAAQSVTELQQRAEKLERQGRWPEAAELYHIITGEIGVTTGPVADLAARAEQRLQKADESANAARRAFDNKHWQEALKQVSIALDYVPVHVEANALMALITPNLPVPEGMVFVPPGEYRIGGVEGNPERTFVLAHGFFADATEVTNAKYLRYLRATGAAAPPGWLNETDIQPPGDADLPVVNITFAEAAAYAEWVGKALPSEEQFECATRGKNGLTYPWGKEWNPSGGVFGFGPLKAGAAPNDISPTGLKDACGNVAEWTTTAAAVPPNVPGGIDGDAPAMQQFRIVKGCSWAGIEPDRPTVVVPAQGRGETKILSPIAPNEIDVQSSANIELHYLGVVGLDSAHVLIRLWLPDLKQWIEGRQMVTIGSVVNGGIAVVVDEDGRRYPKSVNFETDCVAVEQSPKAWLKLRDPSGAVRELKYESGSYVPPPTLPRMPEAPATSKMVLPTSAASAMRMTGRMDARYLNVGFRCILLPWTPPAEGEIRRMDE